MAKKNVSLFFVHKQICGAGKNKVYHSQSGHCRTTESIRTGYMLRVLAWGDRVRGLLAPTLATSQIYSPLSRLYQLKGPMMTDVLSPISMFHYGASMD